MSKLLMNKIVIVGLFCTILVHSNGFSRAESQTEDMSSMGTAKRNIGKGEILVSRGKTEDKLRKDVLAVFWDEKYLVDLRRIFNVPWESKGVTWLCDLVGQNSDEISMRQEERILDLLLYVSTRYQNSKVSPLILKRLDQIHSKVCDKDTPWPGYYRSRLWSLLLNAIYQYGSSEALTQEFWNCMANYEEGFSAKRLFKKFSSPEIINRLKDVYRKCIWSDSAKEDLAEAIANLEEGKSPFARRRGRRKAR